MARVYNFSAGPSMLPEWVLKKAASEMLDYNGSGQSVMEMSHRSAVYEEIIKEAKPTLIFVEHDKRFVEDIANKIILL